VDVAVGSVVCVVREDVGATVVGIAVDNMVVARVVDV
jgi:hypothetical protein